jgi:hypothetical protein
LQSYGGPYIVFTYKPSMSALAICHQASTLQVQ